MRCGLLLGAMLALACGPARADGARDCAAVTADLAAARSAGHLASVAALDAEAAQPAAGCAPKILFCLGRSAALAHVEAAYAAAGAGRAAEAARLFEAGRAFGAPWPLLAGVGDATAARARAGHDPRQWSGASLAYQQAVAALDEPALCADEPPRPDAEAAALLLRKMLLSTLLARPVAFFHDRCAPCALGFLGHGPIDPAHPRPLPITFAEGRADLTPEGLEAAKGLAACATALHWDSLDLSVHTDERGGTEANSRLSARRADTLRQVLAGTGLSATLHAEPAGKTRPLAIDDATGLSPAEIARANRRVELRAIAGPPAPACAAAPEPAP